MRFFRQNPIAILFILLLLAQVFIGGSSGSITDWLMRTLINLPAILIGLSFHEFAHAKVSNMLGDDTPKYQGRLTINPMAHVDPIGFIALLFIGFGWGKPVEINPRMYKNPRRDEFLVAIAGVVTNFLLALAFMGILRLIYQFQPIFLVSGVGSILTQMINAIIMINLVLMVFNLIPIPPLDGFNVITQVFNLRNTEFYYKIYDKGFILLMVLILFNITDLILSPAIGFLYNLMFNIFF